MKLAFTHNLPRPLPAIATTTGRHNIGNEVVTASADRNDVIPRQSLSLTTAICTPLPEQLQNLIPLISRYTACSPASLGPLFALVHVRNCPESLALALAVFFQPSNDIAAILV